jgi:hypothetical protein
MDRARRSTTNGHGIAALDAKAASGRDTAHLVSLIESWPVGSEEHKSGGPEPFSRHADFGSVGCRVLSMAIVALGPAPGQAEACRPATACHLQSAIIQDIRDVVAPPTQRS